MTQKKDKIILGNFINFIIDAIINYDEIFLLIIEDIGKYNHLDVFGGFFQLFERDDRGISKQFLKMDDLVLKEINKKISEKIEKISDKKIEKLQEINDNFWNGNPNILKDGISKIFLPQNLYIWSTLTSFNNWTNSTLDNYFKRRWDFQYVDLNNMEELIQKFKFSFNTGIEEIKEISWNLFRKTINKFISWNLGVNEGRLMGTFFIDIDVLNKNNDPNNLFKIIQNKILLYLYEDIAYLNPGDIFNPVYAKSFSELYKNFEKIGIYVFNNEFQELLKQEIKINIQDIQEKS